NDRGYIYIEAFKPNHIKAACEDIRTLNIQNLQIIPIKERFMIVHCELVQNMITIKLIPRIDYTKKHGTSNH
ncbi:unnamed protein product, partial [Rotaria sp. Silwood2]